jgi:hypothetical protein
VEKWSDVFNLSTNLILRSTLVNVLKMAAYRTMNVKFQVDGVVLRCKSVEKRKAILSATDDMLPS